MDTAFVPKNKYVLKNRNLNHTFEREEIGYDLINY